MKNDEKIEGTVEAWESGKLGRDEKHAKAAPKELEKEIDEALGMQAISIRLSKELIEDFKFIARYHKLGYQPLMRDALKRFAESEYKRIAVTLSNEKSELMRESVTESQAEVPPEKKAA